MPRSKQGGLPPHAMLCLIAGPVLLAGCTLPDNGPAPWENEFEGYEGVRADFVSYRDLEIGAGHRGDRDPPPEPPGGAPASNSKVMIELLKSGSPTTAEPDPYCTPPHRNCAVEPRDAYQGPTSPGIYRYPLGEDGATTIFLAEGTEYKASVSGWPEHQREECEEVYYGTSKHSDAEPAELMDRFHRITASRDHIVRMGYDVECGTWSAP